MDSSAPNGSHQQEGQNGTMFNHFFDGMQEYALGPDDFMYDTSNLFQSNPEQPPVFTHQPIVSDSSWNQNTLHQPSDSGINSYGSFQTTYQNQPYSQTPYDVRQFAPPTYDQRSVSRPSPSPSPYANYQFQGPLAYTGRDPSLTPSQTFHQPQSLAQQRSPSLHPAGFPPEQPHNPYFGYTARQGLHQNLQGVDLANFSSFQGPSSRPTNTFIDPAFLTANGLAGTQQDQYNVSLNRPENRQVSITSTHHTGVPPSGRLSSQVIFNANNTGISQALQPGLQNKSSVDIDPPVQNGPAMPPKPAKAPAKARKPKDPNAPKRPRGRPRKDDSLARVRQEGKSPTSSYDSESDSESETEDPEPMPEILKHDRPDDFEGKVLYETMQAVWSPSNKPAIPDSIRSGIAQFGETIRKLRDAWKAKNAALQQAENTNSSTVPSLKEEVGQYRRLMENVAKTAVDLGHPAHLKKLGENVFTLSALQAVLLDRFNAGDYNGSLVTAILKLVTKFETVDQKDLETAKMAKILVRLTKKADNDSKTLAQTILDNAATATKEKLNKPKLEAPQSPISGNSTTKPPRTLSPQVVVPHPAGSVNSVAGVKRPRETEAAIPPATKRSTVPSSSRPIVQASKPLALQTAERKRVDAAASSAKASDAVPNGTASAVQGKAKGTVVAPSKPATSVFSTLVSASKKPGTSIAARAAAAKDKPSSSTVVKKESPPPASAPAAPKSSFSFMDTLADMSKTKEAEPKKVDDRPPETEEERVKRLRKEERRKLRVSWRPEESLVETRFFTHDPDEEIGQTDSMMRDVTDIGGEGRMLKLHQDLDDLDDEEETQASGEDFEPYVFPSEIDFGELEHDSRMQNFIKYGGTQKPESPESDAQARREENTLMVVYTLPSEVPPSPKEPPPPSDDEDYTPLTSFGEPTEQTRARESKYLAELQARRPVSTPAFDLNALLQQIKPGQPVQQQQGSLGNLDQTIVALGQQQQPQQQPLGGTSLDLSKLLAVVNVQNQLRAQQQPQFPAPTPATQAANPNLAALLAQIQGQAAPPSAYQHMPALPVGVGNPNPYPGSDNDYSRKHGRNDSGSEDHDRAWNKKKKGGSGGGGGSAGSGAASQTKIHPNFKTVVCKFWQEGKCLKGDDCTFRHDEG